jgi:phosphoglycolate phosphatase-like HAD superfamily hydrolase
MVVIIKAMFFDLDGTLLNSERSWSRQLILPGLSRTAPALFLDNKRKMSKIKD